MGPAQTLIVTRHLVWLCRGCDECDPQDGARRSPMPCDGPSKDGAWMVRQSDYDRLAGGIKWLRTRAADHIRRRRAAEAERDCYRAALLTIASNERAVREYGADRLAWETIRPWRDGDDLGWEPRS